MRVDEFCSASCVLGPLSEEVAAAFRAKIDDEYRVNMCAPPSSYSRMCTALRLLLALLSA